MMDMSVSGGASTETTAVAKSARPAGKGDAAGQKNGFSDVLAKASGGAAKDQTDDAQPDQGVPDQDVITEGAAEKAARTIRGRNGAKPIIDLGDAALKGQVDVQPEKIISVEKVAGKPAKDQAKMPADLAFGKLDPKDRSADNVAQAAKGAKHAKTDAVEADTDKNTDTETDDGDISDVLGLLKKDPADGGVALPVTAAAHHPSTKADEANPTGKKLDGIDTKTGGHASDALAAVSGKAETENIQVPGAEDTEAADGRTFRISRADGRGESMDVHIGADQAGPKDGSKKADVENVSVLESRRYIGLAQNSNSAAVTAALSGDSEWARAMEPSSALSNAAEWTSTGKVVNTLKIQMNPLDLGLVTATMRLSGDALNVDLKVETGAAYRQMKEDHGKILEALRSQGYAIDNVTISMAPVERPDAGNQASSQGGNASQQQSLAQQGQGGEARERHNQTAQQMDGGFNGAGESGVEDASAGRAGGSRAGGVYL